jgi:peroxiredoxin
MATPVSTRVRPTERAPDLDLPLAGGGRFVLADRSPERYTMIVFNRGLHCPVCRAQLSELDRRLGDLAERGIEVVSVSGESEERAVRMRDDWHLGGVPLAYGLSEAEMREWGLFVSRGRDDTEPAVFNEPGLFLVARDGTVFYEALLSMPVGRPRLDDLLGGLDYWAANAHPARGEA